MTSYAESYNASSLIHDADSHIMEPPGWLDDYADANTRRLFKPFSILNDINERQLAPLRAAERRIRGEDPARTVELEANVISAAKGYEALGAIDPSERARTIDLLGFGSQLVFSSSSQFHFAFTRNPELAYGGARAHWRAMIDFCNADPRMLPTGWLPMLDPAQTKLAAEEAIRMGIKALWLPSESPNDLSPAHVDYDPLWAVLEDAHVPMVLHVGGGTLLPKAFHNNGRPQPTDWGGGGENLRVKDFPVLHHSPERFIACLVLDGVFERFENLKCGVIELGAAWVPGMLHTMDNAARVFGRNEPLLKELTMKPSDYVRRQIRFTPIVCEDAGWLVDAAGEDLFLFSSDYPHREGGRDPVGDFETSLGARSRSVRDKFYHKNFETLMSW